MTDTLFGYPVRLLVDIPGGEHDVTDCIEITANPHGAVSINPRQLLNEIAVEKRVRARIITRAKEST